MSHEKLPVICRPARQEDTGQVLEFTRRTWEGEDYVPYVWDNWLADASGRLAVAEAESQVVGLGKLTRLSRDDWWLEGLRTNPDYEGRGVASCLHDYLLQTWLEIGRGWLRLATSSSRLPVHHLCQRTGFERVGELSTFNAPILTEDPSAAEGRARFQPLAEQDIQAALQYARQSESLGLCAGLVDLGWEWCAPHLEQMQAAVRQGRAWWWQGGKALLVRQASRPQDENQSFYLELLACPLETLAGCLHDYRCLKFPSGKQNAGWIAPLAEALLPLLEAAGYQRDWEGSLYLFARQHPGAQLP